MDDYTMKDERNAGYSLIELAVTVLVSSVVMASAVLFMVLGLNQFKTVESETELQTESQVAELFLTELFQEATSFDKIDDTTAYPSVSVAYSITRADGSYVIALKGTDLWFSAVDGGASQDDQLATLMAKPKNVAFLAEHVSLFSIDQDDYVTAIDPSQPTPGLLVLSLKFNVMDREYVSNSIVTLRNMKKN